MPQPPDASASDAPIVHLSLSPLEFDARIKRTISALRRAGFPAVPLAPKAGLALNPMTAATKLAAGLTYPTLSLAGTRGAVAAFWMVPAHRHARDALLRLAPSAIHAHDWDALAIAASVGRRLGATVIYDSHEYASAMHSERRLWTLVMAKSIGLIEKVSAPRCSAVIAVSQGIADLLYSNLPLGERPTVVRNLPEYYRATPMPERRNRVLHYHGVMARGRGIERLVEALAHLPENFHLRLVGPERQRDFVSGLRSQAQSLGLSHRLTVLPPVPPEELVQSAADADFGFCVLENDSAHNYFALPNKVFEYIMAGLYTFVSNGAEMAAVIRENDVGSVLSDISPRAIAVAVLSVDDARLRAVRQRNLALAETLNWSEESKRLIGLYRRLGLAARPDLAAAEQSTGRPPD